MIRFINNVTKSLFFALMGLIVVGLSSRMIQTFFKNKFVSFAGGVFITFAVLFLLIIFHNRIVSFLKKASDLFSGCSTKKLTLILGTVCLVTKLAFVLLFNCDSNLHADMSKYISFANQIGNNGIVTQDASYASTFSYTLVYGVLLSPLGKIFGTNSLGYSIFLTFTTTVVMILLFDILRKYVDKTTSFLGIVVYNLLPPGLFQTQVVIHETALLFFHILSLWLILKSFDSTKNIIIRILLGVVAFALIIIGAAVNAAGRIVLVSYAIVIIAKLFTNKSSRSVILKIILPSLCVILLTFSGLKICTFIQKSCVRTFVETPPQVSKGYRLPYGWSLYLGSNFETSGGWNEEDSTIYDKYHEYNNKEDALEYQRNLVKNRFSEYLRNPIKIPIHFFNKISALWAPYFPYSSVPTSPGYQGLIFSFGGLFQKALFMISYIGYIFVYSISMVGVFNKKRNDSKKYNPTLHFMLVPLGFTAALILFEVMPKYSSHMAIILFATAIINLPAFIDNVKMLRCKFTKNSNS